MVINATHTHEVYAHHDVFVVELIVVELDVVELEVEVRAAVEWVTAALSVMKMNVVRIAVSRSSP